MAGPPGLSAVASPSAAFFRTIAGGAPLYEAETPEAAVEMIQHRLGVAPWAGPEA